MLGLFALWQKASTLLRELRVQGVALGSILNMLEKKHRSNEELEDLKERLLDETDKSNSAALDRMQEEMLVPINEFKTHQIGTSDLI